MIHSGKYQIGKHNRMMEEVTKNTCNWVMQWLLFLLLLLWTQAEERKTG